MHRLTRNVLPDPWIPLNEMNEVTACATLTGVAGGTIIGTNNDALYVPVCFPADATIYALRMAGTNTTGNYDLALYDAALNRLVSKGSTAMAASVLELTIADMRVRAGELYYAAAAFNNTGAQIIRVNWAAGGFQRAVGFGLQASAFPLPDPAVPTTVGALAVAPVFAFGVR